MGVPIGKEKVVTTDISFSTGYSTAMIFDSHFHLPSMVQRGLSPALPDAFLGLEIAIRGGDLKDRIQLVGKRTNVYLSAGAGPWVLEEEDYRSPEDEISRIRKDIETYGADAIGECGFDRHWNYGSMSDQCRLFELQAELSKELDIPLIIHTRDADEEMKAHLSYVSDLTIMHCYSSGKDLMYQLLDKGAYISFAGNVTYKANVLIQESAKLCPLDRILYETDSPYLAPVPKRREANRPEYTEYTLDFLSELRGEDRELIKAHALENFRSLTKHRDSVVRRDFA